jgi:hypothetical protein
MKIRNELDKEYESIDPDIRPFEKMFLGSVRGVVLHKRGGDKDTHVIFQTIHEDDGHWFLSTEGASSFFFDDYISVLKAAKKWCKENCDPDGRFGWKFRV